MSVETPEYAAMVSRMLRAYARRVVDGDPEVDLARMVEMRREFDRLIRQSVRDLHDEGWSWGELARGLGTSRQAVQRTYGTRQGEQSYPAA